MLAALAIPVCARGALAGARRDEATLHLIFDHVGEGISVFDAGLRLVAWNRHFADFTGLAPPLLRAGTPLMDCLLAMARAGEFGAVDPEAEAARRCAALADDRPSVTQRRRPDGRTIELRRNPTPGGGFVMIYVDITARVCAEARLQQASELLAQKSHVLEVTLDSLSQGVLSIDAGGRCNGYNRRLLELLELPAALLESRPTLKQIGDHQMAQGQFGPALERLDAPGREGLTRFLAGDLRSIARRYQRTKADGTVLEVQSHFGADGSLVRTFTDVTENVRAEQALRESESRFRSLADAAPALIWVSDRDGRATWFNQRWLDATGRTLADELATGWPERIAAADYARCRAAFEQAFERRARYDIEYRLRRADGREVWVADIGIPRPGADGRFEGYISHAWDVSERKAAQGALIAAKDEAERANRAKSQFLSRMSHELRTPMNAILGFGQLLESDRHDPLSAPQRARVQEMLRGGRHLLALINEVLDLARIESGALQLRLEPVALAPLVDDCLRLVQPVAQARGITLDVSLPAHEALHALADRMRLEQVLLNLLSNAIKYNRRNGHVQLRCRADANSLRIEVSDAGPGIGAAQQARLFQAFERLDADQSAVEGAGIGLALSKWLVDLMHGAIGVDSEVGAGSTFWVALARARPGATADAPVTASGGLTPPAPLHDSTVLYIEDNPVNQVLMEGMLALRPGIRLVMSDEPHAGLALAERERPDLVLLDIQLPEIDGFEVLRRLREQPATRRVPVIAVSANAMPADVAKARDAGFADYLTKPLDMQRLFEAVDRTLAA